MVELLFAPWRMNYILADKKGQKCIFCPLEGHSDRKRLILQRTPCSLVMLNRYPYSYAHLMVAPVRHVGQVQDLKKTEMTDILFCLGQSIEILRKAFHPDGFNVGMNLGQVAGAGVLHHLHFHVVPRWNGIRTSCPPGRGAGHPRTPERNLRRLTPFFCKIGK